MKFNRNIGFDYLRVMALCLVFLQHQFSVLDKLNWVEFYDLNLGQLGVAIFLIISGFLAARSNKEPASWAKARFKRVYPPYWAAMGLSFAAAFFSGYKTFTAPQFFSQMMGLGLFTHRDSLVNVASWFISLLIVLYVQVFIARFFKRPNIYIGLMGLIGFIMLVSENYPLLGCHILSFSIGYVYIENGKKGVQRLSYLALVVLLVLTPWVRNSAYCAVALGCLMLSSKIKRESAAVCLVSGLSYYFFLIHGIFLVGAQHFFGSLGFASILIGLGSSILAAFVMQWIFEKSFFAKLLA